MNVKIEKKSPLILVVDDDPTIRMLARAALGKDGCAVEEAEDGADALSLLRSLKPDLILLDVMMPKMDGFSVCEQVRRLPGLERTPVCMMTGLNDTASIHSRLPCRRNGFYHQTDQLADPRSPRAAHPEGERGL